MCDNQETNAQWAKRIHCHCCLKRRKLLKDSSLLPYAVQFHAIEDDRTSLSIESFAWRL